MKFIIDRTKWLRGEGEEASTLLRLYDGKMCCLGQIANQCGIPNEAMHGVGSPAYVRCTFEDKLKMPAFLMTPEMSKNSEEACRFMSVNDDDTMGDEDRESYLTEGFAKHGIELEFIN